MKVSRSAFAAAFGFFAFLIPANSCGPFFPEAVFVQNSMPDGSYAAYVAGHIGVPQPGYRVQDLVVAYNWLNGHGLTPNEQQQAVALDHIRNNRDYDDSSKRPGFVAWLAARKDSGVSESHAPKPQAGAFPSNPELNGDRPVPGESYQSFTNCLDIAFATAADTLKSRKAAHASDAPSLADWIHGQDAVFANCNGSNDTMPADPSASAPEWLKQDRAYQQAAAKFYQTDYDGAIARLKVISADSASPWYLIARLVEARAMIRRATIGQVTELPPVAVAAPDAPYSEDREKAQRAYQYLVKEKEPARLTEARDALNAILASPSMQPFHTDAAGLLDFVNLRLDPTTQAEILATRLTAPDRAQTPGRFQQALIDLRYYLYPPQTTADANVKRPAPTSPVFSWMDAMRSFTPYGISDRGSWSEDTDVAKFRQTRAEFAANTLTQWQTTHADTWLIATISNTRPGDPDAAKLIDVAAKIPKDSPAWTAATYNRLRLMPDAAMRADLTAIRPEIEHAPQRSTINLFKLLNQRTAPTLADFLGDAASLPAGFTDMDSDLPDPPDSNPTSSLCNLTGSAATTFLFNPDAATILNTRMPLALLAEAAVDKHLPRNLSFQIAQATWTRAVLLNRPEIARRMSPILNDCYPSWKPWLNSYDSAVTANDRRAAALLALMRFPSIEPLVRAGTEREDGFAKYSAFRDNWWAGSDTAQPPSSSDPVGKPATFFGTQPAGRPQLPDPPFLTTTDRTAADRELAALRETPCASDYFATAALNWQQEHPDDPRTLDILGFAERAVRNGCRTDATRGLNHRLFVVVQTKYPKSEWAKRYTTWE